MSIFGIDNTRTFDQALWEKKIINRSDRIPESSTKGFVDNEATRELNCTDDSSTADSNKQFVLLQLGDLDSNKRVLTTTEINPILKGDVQSPDINLWIDFDSFKIGNQEQIDKKTKATLQMTVGQEQKLSGFDKLFYCINGGLNLYDEIKNKKAEAKDFKQSTNAAMGNKPISLPGGMGQIVFKVVKHEDPTWWQRIFSFATTDAGKELLSLVGFGGVTETAINTLSNLLNNLFDREPEVLFKSLPVKLAFSQAGKLDLGGGTSSSFVSCLNPGYWIMVRICDYEQVLDQKPVYYNGFGLLAPQEMSQTAALDESKNPFSQLTYAIIRARMREVDLKQNIL